LDLGFAAFGTGDLAGLLLRLESVAVTKPAFKVVATGATQRKQNHRTISGPCVVLGSSGYLQRSLPMQERMGSPQSSTAPSVWVNRFLPLIKPGGLVLDLAAGNGRHVRLLRDCGFAVCAVDDNITTLLAFAGPYCEVRRIDLETDDGWQLGDDYDGIIITNYLHRPLFPAIARALAPGGVLIYETFARGNERFGRPRNSDFLLRPGELLEAFATLTVVAFEQGEVSVPRPAVIQRLAAVLGPMGPLPEAVDLNILRSTG
jgi:SAM-dependent methyltransferase